MCRADADLNVPAPSAHPSHTRRLVVNADDFGQSAGINEGIIRCHEKGIVTSASLMVRWPFAGAAAEYARATPTLSVGLHLDLGEWVRQGDEWTPRYEVLPLDDPMAVRGEIANQLDSFRRLTGRDPTHIDSHQHVHRGALVGGLVAEVGRRVGVPVRHAGESVVFLGDFYGQDQKGRTIAGALTVERLIDLLKSLRPGITELCCHPGLGADAGGMYVAERVQEARVLCDARVHAAIEAERIELLSFSDFRHD